MEDFCKICDPNVNTTIAYVMKILIIFTTYLMNFRVFKV